MPQISVREVGSSLTTYCTVSSKKSLTALQVNFYKVEYGRTSVSAEFSPEEESNQLPILVGTKKGNKFKREKVEMAKYRYQFRSHIWLWIKTKTADEYNNVKESFSNVNLGHQSIFRPWHKQHVTAFSTDCSKHTFLHTLWNPFSFHLPCYLVSHCSYWRQQGSKYTW